MNTCPVCGTQFVPNAANQKYDRWICKAKAERRRRREREATPETPNGDGLFATLRDPSLIQLQQLHEAYALTHSVLPSRIIGALPEGWSEVIHLDTIVPEYGTENHMYLPQE
jgi:hypothetical protein